MEKTFLTSGEKGMATTIKRWSKATRVILADEERTRATAPPTTNCGYAKTARHWAYRMKTELSLKPEEIANIKQAQGKREIPPPLMTKSLVKALGSNPTKKLLEALIPISNLARTQPPPGEPEVQETLKGFKRTIEEPERFPEIRVREFVSRTAREVFQAKRNQWSRDHSHWSVTNHACAESTRDMGGKRDEAKEAIIREFSGQPLWTLTNGEKPTAPLVDIFGRTVITPEDWGERGLGFIGELAYKEEFGHGDYPTPDQRLGHIGVLWAIKHLSSTGSAEITSNTWKYPGLWEKGVEIHYTLRPEGTTLRCRINPLQEEGWKVRVITMTELAASILGHVARHLIDPVLWSDPLLQVGLKVKVKLWTFVHRNMKPWINGAQVDLLELNDTAVSVDLTTATDVPPRNKVRDTIEGLLDGIDHPHDKFLRFATGLACSGRSFYMDRPIQGNVNSYVPNQHNRGIMMGEPLSGIFLNTMSLTVRAMIGTILKRFGTRLNPDWKNPDLDQFIRNNTQEIQQMLEMDQPVPHQTSTQSGDDQVIFTNNPLVDIACRMAYRIFELEPSENTWYCSKRYALFTEEAALRTEDDPVWTYVDAPKPRVFADTQGNPDRIPLLSKMSLLRNYLRYRVEDHGFSDTITQRCLGLANLLLKRDTMVSDFCRRKRIPLGLPRSLGGIDHPEGLNPDYAKLLEKPIQKYLEGLYSADSTSLEGLEEFLQEFDDEVDAERGVDPEAIKEKQREYISLIRDHHSHRIVTGDSIRNELKGPRQQRVPAWQVSKEAKARQLATLESELKDIRSKFLYKILLSEDSKVQKRSRKSNLYGIEKKLETLKSKFESRPDPDQNALPTLGQLAKRIADRAQDFWVPSEIKRLWMEGMTLPSMDVRFLRSP